MGALRGCVICEAQMCGDFISTVVEGNFFREEKIASKNKKGFLVRIFDTQGDTSTHNTHTSDIHIKHILVHTVTPQTP